MGTLCSPVRHKDTSGVKSEGSLFVTQDSNSEEPLQSRKPQDQQAILQILSESAAAQVEYSSLLQREAQDANSQLRQWVIRVGVISHLLKNRAKAALAQWRFNTQVEKGKQFLAIANEQNGELFSLLKTERLRNAVEKVSGRSLKHALDRITGGGNQVKGAIRALVRGLRIKSKLALKVWRDSIVQMGRDQVLHPLTQQSWNALQSSPTRTEKNAYEGLICDGGIRKRAVRFIVSALHNQLRTAVKRWKQCVYILKIDELVETLKAQQLTNVLDRIPTPTLESAGDQILGDSRLKGAIRSLMRGLTSKPKIILKTWKTAVDQAKMQVSLENIEKKNTEAEGQVQQLIQRMITQKQVFTALKQENRGMKIQISDLLSQLYVLQPALCPQLLFAVTKYAVKCFDPAIGRCQQLFSMRQEIQVNYNSSTAFITPNRIFVCGGGYRDGCICHIGKSAYILEEDGVVRQQPDMLTGRCTHGIIWDRVAEALYVFGGGSSSGTNYSGLLCSCEQFKSSQWHPLPDMNHARSHFNPCWYSSVVYLCGGHCASVEMYDPRSNAFTLLPNVTLPEVTECTVGVESGVLILLVGNYISWLREGRLTSQQRPGYRSWSNCAPVVIGGGIYSLILFENLCRGVNLKAGTIIKDFALG